MPVSVPVCHLDSRQLQQPQQQLMNNQQLQQQQLQQQQQNNPPHLAYQQANHHSYTTVTTSNQQGPGGGVMGPHNVHQQGTVPPHLQQQVSPYSAGVSESRGQTIQRIITISLTFLLLSNFFFFHLHNFSIFATFYRFIRSTFIMYSCL